jgi:arsenite methyltransferase
MDTDAKRIKDLVRENYGKIFEKVPEAGGSCCGSPSPFGDPCASGKILDYSEGELSGSAAQANLGLGCGNPVRVAELKPGEAVLDLGSGPGFDAFLAASLVGESGRVIGVDMTPQMIRQANINAEALKVRNVEFRMGEIERLPVEDASIDVVISNCVINLSPEKEATFREIFRVLKPGGRISISDVLRSGELPEAIRNDPAAYTG